jgi:glycosyltransferase involved in cell wall biosynthesis
MSPLAISAIIVVRDDEPYLSETIDSVLAQTEPPDEIVVVDDGSQDDSGAIAAEYGEAVRVIRQEPLGHAAGINKGIEAARGELIAFLDADDLWTPRKLELQGRALDRDPRLDLVFGNLEEFISPDLSDEEAAQLRPTEGAVPAKLKGTMMIRREAMDRAGPFSMGWKIAEFVDWYSRATDEGLREEMLGEVVLRRRLHRANVGRRFKDSRVEYAAVMAARLRRRRAQKSP